MKNQLNLLEKQKLDDHDLIKNQKRWNKNPLKYTKFTIYFRNEIKKR